MRITRQTVDITIQRTLWEQYKEDTDINKQLIMRTVWGSLSSEWEQNLWWRHKGKNTYRSNDGDIKEKTHLHHMIFTVSTKTHWTLKKNNIWTKQSRHTKGSALWEGKMDYKFMDTEIKMRTKRNWTQDDNTVWTQIRKSEWGHNEGKEMKDIMKANKHTLRTLWRNKSPTNNENYIRSPLKTFKGQCEDMVDFLFLNIRTKIWGQFKKPESQKHYECTVKKWH